MQTHKIATAPTNQLLVCVSAHYHCVVGEWFCSFIPCVPLPTAVPHSAASVTALSR